MKDFSDYKFADLSEKDTSELKHLEDKIQLDSGKDVVLIAYQEKKDVASN